MVEMGSAILEYLERKANESAEFQQDWSEMKDLYVRKLWHQLTMKLQACLNIPNFKAQTDLVELNQVFLNDFKTRINPLALVELCVPISEQIVTHDPQQGIKFMEEIRDKVSYLSLSAVLFIILQIFQSPSSFWL
ncbi:unnamed protein product [Dicrocoelium dendriticum]|nr:unnamed protein product [Dicrocoelium dendriticum]